LRLRLFVYEIWARLFERLYGRKRFMGKVQRLGFGLYLKCGWGVREAEPHALLLIQRHTNIPAPKLLDYIVHMASFGECPYVLITEVPGQTFEEVAETLTTEEIENIGLELRTHIEAFQGIPNPYTNKLCSASGGEISAPHWDDSHELPCFEDVVAFHQWICTMMGPYWPEIKPKLKLTFARFDTTMSVFTHGDIADHNIMIHKGKLSGLIDWETAGWMPVYWDYIISHVCYSVKSPAFKEMIPMAFAEHYRDEFKSIMEVGSITQGSIP